MKWPIRCSIGVFVFLFSASVSSVEAQNFPEVFQGELNTCEKVEAGRKEGKTPEEALVGTLLFYSSQPPKAYQSIQRAVVNAAIKRCRMNATAVIRAGLRVDMSLPLLVLSLNEAGLSLSTIRDGLTQAGVDEALIADAYRAIGVRYEFDPAVVARRGLSVNLLGLTGLLHTGSAKTMTPGSWEVALSGDAHSGSDFGFVTGRTSVTVGLVEGLELAAMFPYQRISNSETINGAGDAELSMKWRFLDQIGTVVPALAVTGTVIFPTGKEEIGSVDKIGGRAVFTGSADVDVGAGTTYVVGMMAEAGFYAEDPTVDGEEEMHALWGVGLQLPVGRGEILLEAKGTVKNDGIINNDFVLYSPSLRYSSRRFQVTGGFQMVDNETIEDTRGGLFLVGIKF